MFFRSPVLVLLCALLMAALRPASAQIYADVTVSGGVAGTFTITLEHQLKPTTVANFIALATGSRGWLDPATGAIRYEPFYQGVTFHRVIKDFMSQTGSRLGDGTDGPGYTFPDEGLGTPLHDSAYVVSMANSGKNTNGSQFFITDVPTPWLDGFHTVFGRVTAGQGVCDQINNTPASNDRPLTPIVIQSVQIYGPSLAAFLATTPALPRLHNANPVFQKSGSTATLDFNRQPFSGYTGFNSGNLLAWARFHLSYAGSVAPANVINVSATASGTRQFYRLARADYSACALADRAGNSFTFSNPLGGTAALNATRTGGTWTFNGGSPMAITSASFTPDPYSARLYLALSNGMQFLLTLNYTTTTSGTYTGQTNVTGFENVNGTMTVSPP